MRRSMLPRHSPVALRRRGARVSGWIPVVPEDEAPPSAEAATADEPAAKPAKKRKRQKKRPEEEMNVKRILLVIML